MSQGDVIKICRLFRCHVQACVDADGGYIDQNIFIVETNNCTKFQVIQSLNSPVLHEVVPGGRERATWHTHPCTRSAAWACTRARWRRLCAPDLELSWVLRCAYKCRTVYATHTKSLLGEVAESAFLFTLLSRSSLLWCHFIHETPIRVRAGEHDTHAPLQCCTSMSLAAAAERRRWTA